MPRRSITWRLQLILNIDQRLTCLNIWSSLSCHEITKLACHLMSTYCEIIRLCIGTILKFKSVLALIIFAWSWSINTFWWLPEILYFLSGFFHFVFVIVEYTVQLICLLLIILFIFMHDLSKCLMDLSFSVQSIFLDIQFFSLFIHVHAYIACISENTLSLLLFTNCNFTIRFYFFSLLLRF